ncbi:cytidine deaminase-like protein [Serendipita vermifera]|nr:cytidine deaminase-like protein [Serendipita vermifera]
MNDSGHQSHISYLQMALEEAKKCTPTPTAFCVGCVIVAFPDKVDQEGVVLSTGYSRELPGNTHAEANALTKARSDMTLPAQSILSAEPDAPSPSWNVEALLRTADIYTTLEPCSTRTSGLAPCANAIVAAGLKRCYIGAAEPPDFVNCEGARILKEGGVEIVWLKGLEEECLNVARGNW